MTTGMKVNEANHISVVKSRSQHQTKRDTSKGRGAAVSVLSVEDKAPKLAGMVSS